MTDFCGLIYILPQNGKIHNNLEVRIFARRNFVAICPAAVYNHHMKIFKYKFTKLIYLLIVLGMVACVAGFAVTLWQCLTQGTGMTNIPALTIIRYILMFFVTVVLFVILLSLLISSYYAVDKEHIKTKFGFITSKYNINDIDVITLDRNTNKLTVTFKDESFIVIVVKEEWYNDFVQAILDAKPAIEYSIISKTGEKSDKDE